MIKIFFTLLFTILFHICFSQNLKGIFIIGGNFNVFHSNRDNTYPTYVTSSVTNNYGLGLTLSYFITDRTALGIQLSESFNSSASGTTTLNRLYGTGFIVKQYFPMSERAGFVCNYSLTLSYGENDKPLKAGVPQYTFVTGAGGSAGLYCFMLKHFAAEATISLVSLQYRKYWHDGNLKSTDYFYSGESTSADVILTNPKLLSNVGISVYYFFINK